MADLHSLSTASVPAMTLVDAALPGTAGRGRALLRDVALAVAGSLLLIAAAKIKVPFWPVPMTMQTFAVLGIGAAYGSRLGAATVVLYLAYGLFGLPVFTNTPPLMAGPAYLMGPTGGFLAGFVLAAAIAGWAAQRGASLTRMALGFVAADLVILGVGTLWLAMGAQLAGGAMGLGFTKAIASGVQPFLLGEILKVALAASLTGLGWSALRKRA